MGPSVLVEAEDTTGEPMEQVGGGYFWRQISWLNLALTLPLVGHMVFVVCT